MMMMKTMLDSVMLWLHHHYIIENKCQLTEEAVGGVAEREKFVGVNSFASGFNLKVLMVFLWENNHRLSLSLSLSLSPSLSLPPSLSLRPTLSP